MNKLAVLLSRKGVKNGIWLYVLQFFNTVIPLVTLPYITRVLSPYNYGVFSSALNLMSYFLVLVEYGFNWSGARKIAIAESKEEVSEIYSSIFFSRLFLLVVSFALMIVVGAISNINVTQYYCMLFLFLMIIGTSVQQIGLFQGLQKMEFVTIVTVIIRAIGTILIFWIIKDSNQVVMYSFLYSFSFLILGFICMYYVRNSLGVRLYYVGVKRIVTELKDGWYLFLSSGMGKVFSGIGITILQIYASKQEVGAYAAIQKIPQMIIIAYTPLSQAVFPIFSKKINEGSIDIKHLVKRIFIILIPLLVMLNIFMTIFNKSIVTLAFGSEYSTYSLLLIPLVAWSTFSIINNLLGTQILVASGQSELYSKLFMGSMAIMIGLTFTLCHFFAGIGVAYASLIGEIILTAALYLNIYIKGINDD